MKYKKVGVLMGGLSAERDVSLESGKAVAAGLERSGYLVRTIDVGRHLDAALREHPIEAAYIALHGRLGEDGTVQGLLELMGIPYTGSSVLASALAMDKVRSKEVLTSRGLPVADGIVLTVDDPQDLPDFWGFPVVVKPADEGSSVGVSIVRSSEALAPALKQVFKSSKRALVERFVPGTEVNVAVLDDTALGAVEIEPHREFYDYSAKYDDGGSTHHIPPRLEQTVIDECLELGVAAYGALGCSGAARVDLIVPPKGRAIILEVNTIPGMTEKSLLPEIAESAGISFDDLVSRVMQGASLHSQP